MVQDYFLRDRQAPTRKISVVNMVVPFVTGMDSPTAYAAHQVWFVDDWQDRFNSSTRRPKKIGNFCHFFHSEKLPRGWGGFWWFEKKTPEVSNLCASRRSKLRRWFFNLSSCSGGVGCGDGYDGKIHGGLPTSKFLGGGFKHFFKKIFMPIWGRFQFWLIFFQLGWDHHLFFFATFQSRVWDFGMWGGQTHGKATGASFDHELPESQAWWHSMKYWLVNKDPYI